MKEKKKKNFGASRISLTASRDPSCHFTCLRHVCFTQAHQKQQHQQQNTKCPYFFCISPCLPVFFIKAGTSREATSLVFSLKNFQKDILVTAVGELIPQMNTTDILVQSTNGTTRITCQVCSKLMIKTPESRISPIVLVFSLLTLNK